MTWFISGLQQVSQAGGPGPLQPHHVPGGGGGGGEEGDLEEGGGLGRGGKLHLLQLLDALWWRDLYLEQAVDSCELGKEQALNLAIAWGGLLSFLKHFS